MPPLASLKMPPGDTKLDLKTAYRDGLRIVWAVCCVVCGVALSSLFIKHYDLGRALKTEQGLRTEKSSAAD